MTSSTVTPRPRRVGQWVVLGLPIVFLLIVGYVHRWMADDGFIYLRIVDQVSAGNGPVFNAGERVEAYTSPAWLAILSTANVMLPLRLEWIAVGLGLAFGAVGLAAAMAGSIQLAGPVAPEDADAERPLFVPAAAWVVVAPFTMWTWQTSGLETSLTWAWLGISLYLLARWAKTDEPIRMPAAVLLGAGSLVRPEMALFTALFFLIVVGATWKAGSWSVRLRTIGAFAILPVAYQIFRMGYFGLMVANTAIAKEGTAVQWSRGISYLRDFIDPYWFWFPVAIVLIAGYLPLAARANNRGRLVLGAFGAGAALSALWVVAVGGDYIHGRMFVPAVFALCAPIAAVPIQRRFAGMALIVPWAILAMVSLRPPQLDGGLFSGFAIMPSDLGNVTTDEKGWGDDGPFVQWFEGDDLYIATRDFAPNSNEPVAFDVAADLDTPAVLASGIGLTAYALGTDVNVVDSLGLAHPIGSHYVSDPNPAGAAGHDKPAPAAWIIAEVAAPDQVIDPDTLGVVRSGLFSTSEGAQWEADVEAARQARDCPALRRLRDAATGHLGPRRFLQNILRAPANTSVRIPPDPIEAREEFC